MDIATEIRKILYQTEYSAIGLIDATQELLYFRSCQLKDIDLEKETMLSYSDTMNQINTTRISPKYRELFARCTSLEYLKDNLDLTGQYSFKVYNIHNTIERYTYYWFDKERLILLFVIDDMSKEQRTDSVTDLLNREGFILKAEEVIYNHPEQEFAILYYDIQRFKAINDLFGYSTGDDVLRKTAQIFQSSFLKPLVFARMEADHFSMLVDVKNLQPEALPELLHYVYQIENISIDIHGICGIYYVPVHSELRIIDMCDRAKLAKSHIANQYIKPYAIFDEPMMKDYEQKSIALIHLDNAIKKKEIQVYYQPIYNTMTEKIVSAEALVRWHSPENGTILPGKFIPALEESGYISRLDEYVHLCIQDFLEQRNAAGLPLVKIAMNLSRMDLMNQHLMDTILTSVSESKFPEGYFNYELTESAYTSISDAGTRFLSELRKHGARVLMDDFGSGASSFSTIRDYNFDIIKLDKEFIHNYNSDKKNISILITLIELAHRLDMKVVAEGVETKEQVEFLRKYGCDFIQGFYYSKPLPQEEFEKLLETDL